MLKVMSDFPYQSSKDLVSIFRAGDLADKKAEASESAWNLLGYCLFMIHDNRAPKQFVLSKSNPTTDADLIAILEAFNGTHPIENPLSKGVEPPTKLNAPFNLVEFSNWLTAFIQRLA